MQEGFIAVELSSLDAEYFLLFQKYCKKIQQLMSTEPISAFELKDGSIEIHCDSGGHWKNVKVTKNNYPQNYTGYPQTESIDK